MLLNDIFTERFRSLEPTITISAYSKFIFELHVSHKCRPVAEVMILYEFTDNGIRFCSFAIGPLFACPDRTIKRSAQKTLEIAIYLVSVLFLGILYSCDGVEQICG
jgi:hypothetical protein